MSDFIIMAGASIIISVIYLGAELWNGRDRDE